MSEMSGNGAVEAAGGNGSPTLTKKDFASDQETRWCPGCGDYAILATVQQFLPELGIPPERIINCWPTERLLAWLSERRPTARRRREARRRAP